MAHTGMAPPPATAARGEPHRATACSVRIAEKRSVDRSRVPDYGGLEAPPPVRLYAQNHWNTAQSFQLTDGSV